MMIGTVGTEKLLLVSSCNTPYLEHNHIVSLYLLTYIESSYII